MIKDLDLLKEIQGTDKEIYDLQEVLNEIPGLIEEKKRNLDSETQRFKDSQSTLQKLQLKQKEKEVELSSKEANIKKIEGQLALVKTNKEYSALQAEIAALKADNSLLEEAIIVSIDQVEAEQAKIREFQKKVEEQKSKFEIEKKELEAKAQEIKTKIDALKSNRTAKIKTVDPEVASIYDRIVNKKHGIALVKAEGDNCPACQIQLRPQLLNEIQIREKLVICENCSRILYTE